MKTSSCEISSSSGSVVGTPSTTLSPSARRIRATARGRSGAHTHSFAMSES